jgi:hypothetical protein
MQFYYGEAGLVDAAESFSTEARNINSMAERYPLTRLALAHALGVVVHTREAFDELNKLHRWPLAYAPLPFAPYAHAISSASPDNSLFSKLHRATNDNAAYRLIVCGYIGRNRRLDAVLRALAQLPEGKRFHLDIYGKLMDGEEVRALVNSLKLEGQVTLRGFVAEKELDAALAHAHLGINLRNPTMGEASASQLRLWSHRLPSLVTQTGWYATLPKTQWRSCARSMKSQTYKCTCARSYSIRRNSRGWASVDWCCSKRSHGTLCGNYYRDGAPRVELSRAIAGKQISGTCGSRDERLERCLEDRYRAQKSCDRDSLASGRRVRQK